MKILRLFVLFSTLLCAVAAPSPARAQAEVSFDFFYDSLAPYGEWIDVGDYGLCWTPNNVDQDWAPYSDGYFAYTDGGWTWVSYEDFGGIVYHYGRWIHLDDGRWCWTPGYDWAPCWVSWRHSPDYIGWAPLPPEARWRRDVGISIWVDSAYDIGPGYYHFCRPRDFGAPVLRAVCVDPALNYEICRDTVNITNITYHTGFADGPVIFVGGPSYNDVNLIVTRPIPALKLVRNANFDSAHWREHRGPGGRLAFGAQTVGNQLIVAAPLVAPPRDPAAFRSQVKTVVAAGKVNKGWGIVKNPAEQNALRQTFRQQAKGLTPETAPAHPVAAAELKGVPAKADPHAVVAGTAERHGKGQRPESVATQPGNVPPNGVSGTPPGPAERHGKGERPERTAAQPGNTPPSGPTTGNPVLKPFTEGPEPVHNPRTQTPSGATFTPNPAGVTSTPSGNGGGGRRGSVDRGQEERPAEPARSRAEQEAAKVQGEGARQRQIEQQREMQIQQQQQFQQRQQAQQQQQQQQRHQQQQQQQPAMDPRQARELERERERQQTDVPPRSVQPPAPRNAQAPPRGNQPPPSNNTSPQPGNKGRPKDSNSKDSKDKDKNGN